MILEILTRIFMWCSMINGGILLLWVLFMLLLPDLVYRIQSTFVPLPRETWNAIVYSLVGLFKIAWLILNVVPWIALLIVG